MLTRRENLLIRPWQERRYIYHREKVQSALPAIDNSAPPIRPHVSCKLKKVQKEAERCSQIVSDNFTLLQHLSNIMRTTRVDHFWEEPPPNFLQRVGVYKVRERGSKTLKTGVSEDERPRTRKEKCYGCSPERFKKIEFIPEERIPFPPPKKRLTRKAESPPDWETQYRFRCAEDRPEFRGKVWKKVDIDSSKEEKVNLRQRRKRELNEGSQSIYLSKGGLTLAVKFPSRTEVLLSNQRGTRVIEKELCECKSFPRRSTRKNTSVALNAEKVSIGFPEIESQEAALINEINYMKIVNEAGEVLRSNEENSFKEKSTCEELEGGYVSKDLGSREGKNHYVEKSHSQIQEECEGASTKSELSEEELVLSDQQVSEEEEIIDEEESEGRENEVETFPMEIKLDKIEEPKRKKVPEKKIIEESIAKEDEDMGEEIMSELEEPGENLTDVEEREAEDVESDTESIREQSEGREGEHLEEANGKNFFSQEAEEFENINNGSVLGNGKTNLTSAETDSQETVKENIHPTSENIEQIHEGGQSNEENLDEKVEYVFKDVESAIAELKTDDDWLEEIDIDVAEVLKKM